MSARFDFLIFGSTPAAALLAGTLAKTHRASVGLCGTLPHPMRPLRGFDLSVAPITRPETWRVLRKTIPQTQELLHDIRPDGITERVSPRFVTQTEIGAEGLAHMRNIAAGFGVDVAPEPISEHYLAGYRFPGALRVLRRPLAQALPTWLSKIGVETYQEDKLTLLAKKGQNFALRYGSERLSAAALVYMDDEALLSRVKVRDVSAVFHTIPHAAVMLEPIAGGAKSIVTDVDRGTTLHQRASGALDCVGPGSIADIARFASTYAAGGKPVRLAGHARYTQLIPRDGAPVCGIMRAGAAHMIGGLGPTTLFQVPALARYLASESSDAESDYFAARKPSGRGKRPSVAEFLPISQDLLKRRSGAA